MTLALRHRPVPPSPVARWDARWKLAAALALAAGAAAVTRPGPSAAAFAAGLLLVAASRLPWAAVRARLGALLFTTVPFFLVLPFTLADPAGHATALGFDLGPLRASERGVLVAAGLAFRCLAVGCLAAVLVGTAPVHHTLAAARRLGLPGVLVQLALLAYRYAFLLADEFRRLRIALRVRGFRPRTDAHTYRTVGHATGALLVRGADQADRVAEAMRCRGFDGTFHTLTAFRTTPADVGAFLLCVAGTIALVAWDRS